MLDISLVSVSSGLITAWFFAMFSIVFSYYVHNKFCRELFFCVAVGLWAGLVIGFITEYYTSNAYR